MNKDFLEKHGLNLLLLLISGVMLFMSNSINNAENEIEDLNFQIRNLQDSLYGMQSDFSNTVSESLNKMEDTINKEVDIVTEYSYKLGNIEKGSLPIEIKATPKTYNQSLTAQFVIIGDNDEYHLIDSVYDGVQFIATSQIPLYDSCNILLQIDENGTITTNKLTEIYPLDEVKLQLDVSFDRNSASLDSNGKLDINSYIYVFNMDKEVSTANIQMCDVVTTINNKEVYRDKLIKSQYELGTYTFDYRKSLDVHDDDTISIEVIVQDSNDLLYIYPVESYIIEEDYQGFHFGYSEESIEFYDSVKYVG